MQVRKIGKVCFHRFSLRGGFIVDLWPHPPYSLLLTNITTLTVGEIKAMIHGKGINTPRFSKTFRKATLGGIV